jgi:hypothetical protein
MDVHGSIGPAMYPETSLPIHDVMPQHDTVTLDCHHDEYRTSL